MRESCVICGGYAVMHHPDYDRPLFIIWLCKEHHQQHHRLEKICVFTKEEKAFKRKIDKAIVCADALDKARPRRQFKNNVVSPLGDT